MRIALLGAEFNIKTDQDPEYLEEVIEFYKSKIAEVRSGVGTSDPLKIAILAGILAAEDCLRQTGSQRSSAAELSQITVDLITALDSALGTESDSDENAGEDPPAPGVQPE